MLTTGQSTEAATICRNEGTRELPRRPDPKIVAAILQENLAKVQLRLDKVRQLQNRSKRFA
jgi:hypothetical protein